MFLLGSFKEHGVLIYLSKELYTGFIKLQADKDLGRSYAGLLPFVEGLHKLGYISPDVYQKHIEKYSVPLGKESLSETPVTPEERKQKQLLKQKNDQFKGMLDQWNIHDLEWKIKTVVYAKKYSDLEYAKLIIEKEKEFDSISQGLGEP